MNLKRKSKVDEGMPLQGTYLGKRGTIIREWLCLEPRLTFGMAFKTMGVDSVWMVVPCCSLYFLAGLWTLFVYSVCTLMHPFLVVLMYFVILPIKKVCN